MLTDFRALWLPRRGNAPEHYEDAFAADSSRGRFALADGATDSSFAGLWARLMVEHFVRQATDDPVDWLPSLPVLRNQWYTEVSSRTLPWYGEAGIEQGAFATFLGVVVEPSQTSCHWRAGAVGDTCLFHTHADALLRAFPLEGSAQFNNIPRLVGSRARPARSGEGGTDWIEGDAVPGDRLWLATDALAQWCLEEHEAHRDPWSQIEAITAAPDPQRHFAARIEALRDNRRLRNDDVTLMRIIL